MDFIKGLSRTSRYHDSIMVVVDKITKDTQLIPMKSVHKAAKVVEIYMQKIARILEVRNEIILDRDPKFTSNFWTCLLKGFKTALNFSKTYHPKSNRKTERVHQLIEDMLRMYAMDKPSKWEEQIHLVDCFYYNGY